MYKKYTNFHQAAKSHHNTYPPWLFLLPPPLYLFHENTNRTPAVSRLPSWPYHLQGSCHLVRYVLHFLGKMTPLPPCDCVGQLSLWWNVIEVKKAIYIDFYHHQYPIHPSTYLPHKFLYCCSFLGPLTWAAHQVLRETSHHPSYHIQQSTRMQ